MPKGRRGGNNNPRGINQWSKGGRGKRRSALKAYGTGSSSSSEAIRIGKMSPAKRVKHHTSKAKFYGQGNNRAAMDKQMGLARAAARQVVPDRNVAMKRIAARKAK